MPKTRELHESERLLIYKRRREGQTLQQIATDFGITKEGVRKMYKKIETIGKPENSVRTGRKRKTTPRQDREIVKITKREPFITAKQLKEDLNLPIGTTQIKSRLYEAGLHGRISRKKPHISETNARKRLNFAKEHYNKPTAFWESIIWSDESKFELRSNKRRKYVWRKQGEAFKQNVITSTVKHGGGSIMLWGCFNNENVGKLTIIDGILTAAKYIDILKENLFPSIQKFGPDTEYIFQHDNDPKHTAKIVKKFIDKNNISLLSWPLQSPDLNPIEHLWDELDRKIPKSDRYTKPKLIAALKKAWDEVQSKTLKKLIHSMPNRLLEVIKAKGYQTAY
ncbi:Transposable element Tc1 transposase [Anthophora quadrimaculata]